MDNGMVIDENFDWLEAHREANKKLRRRLKKGWIMDDAKDEVQEALLGLELIREVASRIMHTQAADLVLDILLCVANEVRSIKTLRTPIDSDCGLFADCRDDNAACAFIEHWHRWAKWE